MKKFKRFGAFVLALGMLCALAVPASAADISMSESAGDTIQCLVVDLNADGSTVSEVIHVAIPEGATKAEENALIRAAALDAETFSTRAIFDTLDSGYVTIGTSTSTLSSNISLPSAYATLIAQFDLSSVSAYQPTLTVMFSNSMGDSYSGSVQLNSWFKSVVVRSTDGFAMGNGTSVTVRARVSSGTINGNYDLLATDRDY